MARRILVADDEPNSADLLALVLSFRGYEVTRAYDGVSALRTIREVLPDLVLLDECMPGLTGSEICAAIRSEPATRDCTVVLFSSVDELDIDWRRAGAAAFLQKPLDVRALPQRVERLLRERDRERTRAA